MKKKALAASVAQRLRRIQELLGDKGRDSRISRVAEILDVDPASLWRWEQGASKPRKKSALGIEMLYRILSKEKKGDKVAARMAKGLLNGIGAPGALCYEKILVAIGADWLFGDFD